MRHASVCAVALAAIAAGAALSGDLAWQRHTLGKSGMSVDLPGSPTVSAPRDLGTIIQEQFVIKLPFIQLTCASVTTKSGDYILDGGVRGVIRQFEQLAEKHGGTVNASTASVVKRGSYAGRSITGAVHAGASNIRFQLLMFASGPRAWYVLAVHNDGDTEAQSIATRVLKSFALAQ